MSHPRVPGHVVLEEVGAGTEATVFKVRNTALELERALWLTHGPPGPQVLEIARAHARLVHPSLVQVFDAFDIQGRIGLIVDLLPRSERGLRSPTTTGDPDGRIGRALLEVFEYAHRHGFAHVGLTADHLRVLHDSVRVWGFTPVAEPLRESRQTADVDRVRQILSSLVGPSAPAERQEALARATSPALASRSSSFELSQAIETFAPEVSGTYGELDTLAPSPTQTPIVTSVGTEVGTGLASLDLDSELGRGAMGVVFHARHLHGTPVAVKIDLRPQVGSDAAFLREVQLVAGLDHPNVVSLFDHGRIDASTAGRLGRGLRPGARWVAMELALGGTLEANPPQSWQEIVHVVRSVLRGLAHIHARGVVHRDLKPANLLLAGGEPDLPTRPASFTESRIVLTDFGVSEERYSETIRRRAAAGTPLYMAPELIAGRWWEQGPWTDLYALGVMVWLWCTGRHPFDGTNPTAVLQQHLRADLPDFEPRIEIPSGVEDWIRWLLSRSTRPRARCAADAMAPLDDIGPRETGVPSHRIRARPLHGMGLALFGMRTIPFVGREAERRTLLHSFDQVRRGGSVGLVVVRGAGGSGKSRLARWVMHHVHESGLGVTFEVAHRPGAVPGAGMVAMVAHELGARAGPSEDLLERVRERIPGDPLRTVALLTGGSGERFAAQARQTTLDFLTQMARSMPVVVVFDDVHEDPVAIELLRALVDEADLGPVLAIAVVRDEDLVGQSEVEDSIRELVEAEPAVEIRLQPLDPQEQRELVRGTLGLAGPLAERLERAASGNPALARELLGTWLAAGALVASDGGFELRPGPRPVPDNLSSAWNERVQIALSLIDDREIAVAEVASALGMDFDIDLWQAVCSELGLGEITSVMRLLASRFLLGIDPETDSRLRFAHRFARDALERRARASGRWPRLNGAIAGALTQRTNPGSNARLAWHLLEAEAWDEAVDPLAGAIEDQIDSGDPRSADLLDRLEDVLRRLELPESNDQWGRLLVLRASRHRLRGELEEAEQKAEDAVYAAQRHGWKLMAARALRESARVLFARAAFGRALTRATEAEQAFLALGDRLRAADCGYTIAEIQSATGQLDEAQQRFLQVIAVFEKQGREFLHNPLLGMVQLQHRRGDRAATAEWLERCRDHAQPLGLQWVLANCANIEGELARAAGDNEAASSAYREAAERYRAIESPDFAFPLLNLGILDVAGGAHDVAVQRMQPLILHCRRRPNALVEGFVHMVLMVSHAGLGDRDAAAESLNRLVSYVGQSSLVDPDVAEMAERAGMLMRKAGWEPEAGRALRLADTQYRSCGRADDAARVRQSL